MARNIPIKIKNAFQPRVKLEPYGRGKRYTCPQCKKKQEFTRYIDITTGEYFGEDIGKCNRVEKCGYHKPPTGDLFKNKPLVVPTKEVLEKYQEYEYTSILDAKYIIKTLNEDSNNFISYLVKHFDPQKVFTIINRYRIGTSSAWKGATIFWQIDQNYDIRTGKIMLYDEKTCKRVKNPYNHITWAHTPLKQNEFGDNVDFSLTQCFFGEHLINENTNVFHVVESEKTAVLCSIINPKSYWIATGGIQNINDNRMYPFKKGKKLVFYPDKGKAFLEWKRKLQKFQEDWNIEISDFMEKQKEYKEGEDIGDYIINKYTKK